jgi:IS1 family transposase
MVELFQRAPAHLYVMSPSSARRVILQRLEAELDELWSFVGKMANRHWIWIAMDATTHQVIAFHIGDRSQASAEQFWTNLPAVYREQAMFYTDQYTVYKGVIPPAQPRSISKLARKTKRTEQRKSLLVRSRMQGFVHGGRITGNHYQIGTGSGVGFLAALFPIAQGT